MSKNPDKTPPATANAGTEQNIAADVDEVMRKYDRESNTRIWSGWQAVVIKVFMAAFALLCICMTLFSTAMPEIRLPGFMGFIVLAGFLNFPASKHHVKPNYLPWYDILLMVIGAGCFFYFAFNAMTMIKLATRIQPIHVVIGVVGILVLVELCRRCVGLPILVVAGLLIVYAFYNQLSYNPSFYQALKNIIYKLFYTTSGVIGTPISVCYTYIVLFIIFGAFLERTGIANFFISFANRLTGWSSGGPAKVAVISSALCGMVSGSSVGNTVTTGSFTIPMMKKTGYKPEFAGAVEAAASTGGQIMPPIMGAAAFLMAEYIGIPYAKVAVKAILPAILYFTGIFISVHLEAKKLGLRGIPRDQLPKWGLLARDCYLILPLILLVWLVSSGAKTMSHSAAYSILAAIAVGLVNFFLTRMRDVEEKSAKTMVRAIGGALADSGKSAVDSLEAGEGRDHCCRRVRDGRYHRGLHHSHGSGFDPDQCHRPAGGQRDVHRPHPDHGLLHHPRHGRADDGKLLHHGLHLRADPHQDGVSARGGAFLRVLLRHRRRYHAAGRAGGLRGLGHCKVEPHEDRHQRDEARYRRIHCAVHLLP